MKIDVKKVAQLARIQVREDKIQEFEVQFEKILDYFSKLQSIETQGIRPLVTPHEMYQNLREDEVNQNSDFSEKMLEQAPMKKGCLVEVPPFVGGES